MLFVASDLPEQKERIQAIALARSEMETVVAKLRIANVLKRKVPPAATTMITPGSQVLLYREKEKQWVGPVIAKTVDGNTVHIQDHQRNLRPFSVTVCKPYLTSIQAQEISLLRTEKSVIDCFHWTSECSSPHVSD